MTTETKSIVRQPTVAIVGRTNVGKSTLFNRFVEESKALVSEMPGTTRAPNYGDVLWRGRIFTAVDTGGLDARPEDPFGGDIEKQAEYAMHEADLILFVVDLRIGITPEDRALAKVLTKSKKPVLLVGNKAERDEARNDAANPRWRTLSAGDCIAVSAATGQGVGDLLDEIFRELRSIHEEPPTLVAALDPICVVIAGKPNVGKSSLLNSLVGAPRAIVSEIAHTTREPQDTLIRWNDQLLLLVDTAGVRKKIKSAPGLEGAGVRKTLESIRRANLALLVIDLTEGVTAEDRHLAGLLIKEEIGVVVVANKWDLVPDKHPNTPEKVRANLLHAMPFLSWAPILFVSAKTGEHVQKIFRLMLTTDEARRREITPNALDRFFRKALKTHRPSRGKGVRHPYIYNMQQTDTRPPTFLISVRGRRDSVHPSYLKYLENQLREYFDFTGTPVVIKSRTIRPTV